MLLQVVYIDIVTFRETSTEWGLKRLLEPGMKEWWLA